MMLHTLMHDAMYCYAPKIDISLLHFGLSEFEELYVLGANLVLALQLPQPWLWTLFEHCACIGPIALFVAGRVHLLLLERWMRLSGSIGVRVSPRLHDFELLLEAGLGYFFVFEFLFESGDVVEREEAVGVDVLLAGLAQVVVVLLPKELLLLALLQLLPSLL